MGIVPEIVAKELAVEMSQAGLPTIAIATNLRMPEDEVRKVISRTSV